MQIGSLAKKCIKYDLGGEKDEKGNKRRMKKLCRDPGSNRGPLDLQSNALPTELSRLLLDKRVCHTKTTSPQNLREICRSVNIIFGKLQHRMLLLGRVGPICCASPPR